MRVETIVFYLLILFLPTQLGKHFWPDFSIVSGMRVDYLSPIFYVTDVIILFLFVSWTVRVLQNVKFKAQYRLKLKTFLGVLLFLLINIWMSQNIWNGLYHLLKFLEFTFVAYYVATVIKKREQVKRIFLLLGIGVIGESLLAIAQLLKQGSLGGMFYLFGERLFTASTPGIANASINGELVLRPYGTFPHPNVLAGFLLFSMICLLFTWRWVKRSVENFVWVTALLLGSGALLLTMSRVACLLWVVFLTGTLLQHLRRRGMKIIATVAILGCLLLMLVSTPFGARLLQTNPTEEAVIQRVDLIKTSGELFVRNPLVGVGFGNFLPSLATMQKSVSFGLALQPVHNMFLLIFVEMGIIGLGIFIWFLVKTYRRLFRLGATVPTSPYQLLTVLLSVVLILGSFDHYFLTLQQGQLLFALVIGLSWIQMKTN